MRHETDRVTPCAQGNLNFDKTSLIPSLPSSLRRSEFLRQSCRTGVSAFVAPELDLLRVIADRALSQFIRKFHTDMTGERTTSSADGWNTFAALRERVSSFSTMKAATSSRVKIRFHNELSSISSFRLRASVRQFADTTALLFPGSFLSSIYLSIYFFIFLAGFIYLGYEVIFEMQNARVILLNFRAFNRKFDSRCIIVGESNICIFNDEETSVALCKLRYNVTKPRFARSWTNNPY